jgi:NAD(P)-dependent dehydrogenase (short-subunit alcohol dehydrogenase family)
MADWFTERAQLGNTVAVVTGGAGGLGRAITEDLAANGVRVAVIDIDREATEFIARNYPDAVVHHGDVRDVDALTALFDAVDERWGRLDTLANVVGGTFPAEFVNTRPKGWEALLRANLLSVLHSCSLAIPRIVAGGRGGSIVNITTIEAHRAAPNYAVYSAAKAAVEQFARTLAVELAPQGIRVNNVAPDFTPTPNILGGADPAGHPMARALGSRIGIPMGRPGHVHDVSSCVVFLASRLSAYITGTTLHPDGGTHASSGWFNWPEGWCNYAPHNILDFLENVGTSDQS